MCAAEAVSSNSSHLTGSESLWAVRVLLAGALARALRCGVSPADVREMFEELVRNEEEGDE